MTGALLASCPPSSSSVCLYVCLYARLPLSLSPSLCVSSSVCFNRITAFHPLLVLTWTRSWTAKSSTDQVILSVIVLVHIHDQMRIFLPILQQTFRSKPRGVDPDHGLSVVKPHSLSNKRLNIGDIPLLGKISPARKVSVLGGYQFVEDTLRIETPGAVPPGGHVLVSNGPLIDLPTHAHV